jgi:general stress protein 26
MSRRSGPVEDLAMDPTVNVAYADPDADSYVSVSGVAEVVDNAAKKKQLWNKMNEAWFTQGVDDPDLALIQVRITHANYWDVKSSKVVQLFTMLKAAVTGKTPSDNMADQGEVRMR